MTRKTLKLINEVMKENHIPYAFMEWKEKLSYPYFVGNYSEVVSLNEDGETESTFTLTGFSRNSFFELMEYVTKIKDMFPAEGMVKAASGYGVAIFYETAFPIPSEDEDLERVQINLSIKEWR